MKIQVCLKLERTAVRLSFSVFRKLQLHEVLHELKNLDENKAVGWDSISPAFLQIEAEGIAASLTNLYNKCIELEQWPKEWKKG